MSDTTDRGTTEKKKGNSFLKGLIWWRVEAAEVENEVAEYRTRKPWKSSRGVSAGLCALTVVLTVALSGYLNISTSEIVVEVCIWSTLGYFMYRGHRWAFIIGMLLWTFEKAVFVVDGGGGAAPIMHVIWWAIYMNAFYMGFTVERRRALAAASPPAAA
jgi:hypothetical protein